MSLAFVGRQPIFNTNLQVYGYEILFRSSMDNRAIIEDGDEATAKLVINTFTELGLAQVTGSHTAFINITRNFLLNGYAYALPRDAVVLEIIEDIEPTEDVIREIRKLSKAGYKIALDDFVYSPHLQPLIDVADIIKVELPAITPEDLPHHVELLRSSGAAILAEKIETHEEFEFCQQLGFDLFQGYFLSKPKVITGKRIPENQLSTLQLMNLLHSEDTDMAAVVRTISANPTLCVRILRFVNAASTGLRNRIDSIQTAVNLFGLNRLKTFASLALLATTADAKPAEITNAALTRARMCELLGKLSGHESTEMHFIAGLFSLLDVLLDQPMVKALDSVHLATEIEQAIQHELGPLAEVLSCILNYEKGNWDQVQLSNVDPAAIRNAYLEATNWAAQSLADF
ncbi:MAG: HDOD domain-containing protein [Fuerstiella sp.]